MSGNSSRPTHECTRVQWLTTRIEGRIRVVRCDMGYSSATLLAPELTPGLAAPFDPRAVRVRFGQRHRLLASGPVPDRQLVPKRLAVGLEPNPGERPFGGRMRARLLHRRGDRPTRGL